MNIEEMVKDRFDERLFNNNKMELIDVIIEDNQYLYIYLDEHGYIHHIYSFPTILLLLNSLS